MENKDIRVLGQMDNTMDNTLESANRVYDSEYSNPTIPTCCGGGHQPKIMECHVVGGIGEMKSNRGTQFFQQDRVYSEGDVAPCMQANLPGGSYKFLLKGSDGLEYEYAIRKLTPRECWRLMDFTDEQFERAAYELKTEYLEGGDELCCAKLKVVPEKQKQSDSETYVLCTTSDSQGMEILKTIKSKLVNGQESEKMQSVSFAIEKLVERELSGYATNTTRCLDFMGTHFILTEEKGRQATVIIAQAKEGKQNTERSMKITTELNLDQKKLYTILILTEQIMQSKIFGATHLKANISGYTQLIEDYAGNMGLKILSLKMESMCIRVRQSQLYKQAGNSIVVSCLEAIFSQMGIGEKWNDRDFEKEGEP